MKVELDNKLIKQEQLYLFTKVDKRIKATPVSLTLPKNLEFDKWHSVMEVLKVMEGSMLWWIGDALVQGEQIYGEMYSQVLDSSGYEYQQNMCQKTSEC